MKFKPTTTSIVASGQGKDVLNRLDPTYVEYSEMSVSEREFLTALILQNRPTKLVEVGVAAGGSAVVMLNAIQSIEDAKLYSIDYQEAYYRDCSKISGFVVGENYPSFLSRWKLYTGGMSHKFMNEIGENIDFAMFDTTHTTPGEILDFLMVLPYLTEDALVVFHDTSYHAQDSPNDGRRYGYATCLLMSAIYGEKITMGNFVKSEGWLFPNIAAIKLNAETRARLWEVFNLLTIKWQYIPSDTELNELIDYFDRFYGEEFVEYFREIIVYHKRAQQEQTKDRKGFASKLLRRVKAKMRGFVNRLFGAS